MNSPVKIQALPPIKKIVPLGDHVFFWTTDDEVFGCGSNYHGVLGVGDNDDRYTPVKLELPPIMQIDGSWNVSFFLTKDGRVFACGKNELKQISLGLDAGDVHPENYYGLVELTKINEPIVKMQVGGCSNVFLSKSESVFVYYQRDNSNNDRDFSNSEVADFRSIDIPIPDEVLETSKYRPWLYAALLYKFGPGTETAILCHKKLGVPLSLKLLSCLSFMSNRNHPINEGVVIASDVLEYMTKIEDSQKYDRGLRKH